ncbi:hypothetical protein ACET3Z_010511 [Daucus carota]
MSSSSTSPRSTSESGDFILPSPPSRHNGGAADLSPTGLLAYAASTSVSIVDSRSMQLISVIPIPPPPSTPISSFITSVRWSPQPLRRDILAHDPSTSLSHLLLAAGDRYGGIALLDLRIKAPLFFLETPDYIHANKPGIQDLCWIQARVDSWILASLSGPSLLSLYNTSTGRCFFKYDAAPELFACVRRDPFDSRHFCALGLKGFLLSAKAHSDGSEEDIQLNELRINTDSSEIQRLEKDAYTNPAAAMSPPLAIFPTYVARVAFSPHWRHILFLTFPKELLVFDLKYEVALFVTSLPRGVGKFIDVLPDPSTELLHCAHLDGKFSTWRRKEGQQVHTMCMTEELMPLIGSSVPSPTLLAVTLSSTESVMQNFGKHCSNVLNTVPVLDIKHHFEVNDSSIIICNTHLIAISDDGKIWDWLLTAEGNTESLKEKLNSTNMSEANDVNVSRSNIEVASTHDSTLVHPEDTRRCTTRFSIHCLTQEKITFKINLVGQLHLLSSTITVLAVPTPSLTAIVARGGNYPAVAVPLVALGSQSGTIEVIDVSANSVAASFYVHNNVVRGLRWLGNSRLVSYSYTLANEKSGGYINKLVVTSLKNGQNRPFRVLHKSERAPVRALKASSSGRYLLIMFRDAPVEVWAMTKTPLLLRSLALPFTVIDWTLPTVPRPGQTAQSRHLPVVSEDSATVAQMGATSPRTSTDSLVEGSQDESAESFAFALVNGALGVFEVHGRRIRDFRPKWPSSSFVSTDGLVTALCYRLPHVVTGDKLGNIRWWDVTTGQSSSFNTQREGIKRIKFSPVAPGDRSRGRIAVLYFDNTFAVFDLDSQDPLASSLLQPQFPGILVLELEWLPLRTDRNDPLVLCIAGADGTFRLTEVNIDKKGGYVPHPRFVKERFRPVPLCSPVLLPTPHALALRMILQLGVKRSWFDAATNVDQGNSKLTTTTTTDDLRSYLIDLPPVVGDSVVPELLLKVLEPYRKEGSILDDERVNIYNTLVDKGSIMRFAFAAVIFGEYPEALFWLLLPRALKHWITKIVSKSHQKAQVSAPTSDVNNASMLVMLASKEKAASENKNVVMNFGQLKQMAFEHGELWEMANERITWHEKLEGEQAVQKQIHELVALGNLEAAVTLMLSTPPESSYFPSNALRAVALSSAVSKSLFELSVNVVAANMVRTDRSFSGTHLLSAVGRYQEACSQLQDAGCWTDASTLAATHLKGSAYARVLQRWADHVWHVEHNIWRAMILYVAAGAFPEALVALREAQQPEAAAMFIVACHEIQKAFTSDSESNDESGPAAKEPVPPLPGLNSDNEDVIAVGEYYGEYQRKLVHLCMDSPPLAD